MFRVQPARSPSPRVPNAAGTSGAGTRAPHIRATCHVCQMCTGQDNSTIRARTGLERHDPCPARGNGRADKSAPARWVLSPTGT